MMKKTCKNHKLFLVKELIFYNNPKANGKNSIGFLFKNQRVMLTKCVITAALYTFT